MYHAIVRRITRSTWKKMDQGDLDAPWRLAAPDLEFIFGGTTSLSGRWVGRDEFRNWLIDFRSRFDELNFTLEEIAVHGWPWNTTVATRVSISGRWAGGASYENEACQWATLRWGRMTRDRVLEDTKLLHEALEKLELPRSTQ